MEGLKTKTYKALLWDLGGKFADQGIGFVISVILTRLLSPSDFGLLAMAMVIISVSHIFIDMGFGSALVQRKHLKDEHYGSVFYFNITVGAFLTILLFLLSPVLAEFYNNKELANIFRVLSFTFIINSLANVQRTWLSKNLNFKTLTNSKIAGLIIGGVVGIAMAFMGYGVWALVFQSLLSGIVSNLYIYFFTGWRPVLKYSFGALKELWAFGGRLFGAGLLNTIASQIDNLLIGKLFPTNLLGYYYRAKSMNQFIIRYTSGSLMSVLFPVLSNVQDDNERYVYIVKRAYHFLAFITFFLLGILYVSTHDLFLLLFGVRWIPAVHYFKILLYAGYAYPISALLVNIIMSRGNSKAFLRLDIYKQSLILVTYSILFFSGIDVFLYSLVGVRLFAVLLNIFFVSREIKVSVWWFVSNLFLYASIAIISVITILFFMKEISIDFVIYHLIIEIIGFVCIFGLLIFLLRPQGAIIFIDEIKQLWNKMIKKKFM